MVEETAERVGPVPFWMGQCWMRVSQAIGGVIGRKGRAIVIQVSDSVEKPTAVLTLLVEVFGSIASAGFRVAIYNPSFRAGYVHFNASVDICSCPSTAPIGHLLLFWVFKSQLSRIYNKIIYEILSENGFITKLETTYNSNGGGSCGVRLFLQPLAHSWIHIRWMSRSSYRLF